MLCHVFIIASVLPSFMLAEVPAVKSAVVRFCNSSDVTAAGDDFFKCFNDTVKHSLNANHEGCRNETKSRLKTYVTVANTSCYKDTTGQKRDGIELYDLIDYSLNHLPFKDFIKNDGAACILEVKDNIKQCVKNIVGVMEGADDKYHTLWRKTHPYIERRSCKKSLELKLCTLNVIRGHNCRNEPYVSLYVSSIFEYMLEQCARLVKFGAEPALPPPPPLGHFSKVMMAREGSSSTALLGVLLALVLISMIYVIVRDCRASTGIWKPTESFAMRSRRRSLVHNEACDEN